MSDRVSQGLSQCVNALGRHDRHCPAAPVVQGADELRQAIARAMLHNPAIALRGDESRVMADAVLALPEVARFLAERDQAQAKVARVEALAEEFTRGDPIRERIRRALDGSA